MFLIMLLSLALALPLPPSEEMCTVGCVPGGCYTLALRYVVNVADVGPPAYIVQETFTGENYPTREDAFCGARKIRREGYRVVLPPEVHGGAESNVMPETITPMPVL